jgi:hypothetical protein
MGFQQELAVTMEGGEKRPLTPTDIRQQTGLLKQCVNRGLVELEDAGLALRKAPDGGALRKGNVLLYSWASPRQAKEENSKRARLLLPDWFPESWEPLKPLISRYKYSLTVDEGRARAYFDDLAADARAYKEIEMVIVRKLESLRADDKKPRSSLYRKNGKNIERKDSSSSAVLPVKAEEEDRSAYRQLKAAYPAGHFDEGKTKPSFDRKTGAQQQRVLERLQVYLACERWQDDGGRWIPLSSNWLESCEADPPPALKKAKTATVAVDQERLQRIAANVEEDRKWR